MENDIDIVLQAAKELGEAAGKEITDNGWQNERPKDGETWLGMIFRLRRDVSKMQKQVLKFHQVYGLPAASEPTLIGLRRIDLRYKLIKEELEEYRSACDKDDLVEIADALGDLLYVVYGAAIEHGINLQPVVDEIQRSNMSKLGSDGKPIYAENGKVLKGPNFFRPTITTDLMRYPKDISEILNEL